MEYKDALKILKRENIDLDEFESSEEYRVMCCQSIFNNIYKDLVGFTVTIDGNVEQIIIHGKGEIKLLIVYSLRSDMLYAEQIATVIVKEYGYKKWIRENLRPNTKIKCTAKYNGSANCFDLVSIVDTSLSMKFGHYICSECGYDYGKKVDSDYCCICEGAELKYVDNFYVDEMKQEQIKALIELSISYEYANKIIEEYTGCKTYSEKIAYIKRNFECEIVSSTDNDEETDYVALLTSIINRKWY